MDKKEIWKIQSEALRNPMEIVGTNPAQAGIHAGSLRFTADQGFIDVLKSNNLTLICSREYEHLLLAFSVENDKILQSYFSLPHPSGIAFDRKNNNLYIASTRNPNYILEMTIPTFFMDRIENKGETIERKVLMPSRTKYFAGATYFHDLAFIENDLYANSVGQNGIVKIDMNSSKTDKVIWQPKNKTDYNLDNTNYLQLNSIAAAEKLEDSFFSASVATAGKYRPGNLKFPINKTGVIFSAKTGEVFAKGLTRPHSARIHNGKIWVCDSGYGTVGTIEDGKYKALLTLPGWTRGLHFSNNILFVGISHVLERFKIYAPGIQSKKQMSAIFAFDSKTLNPLGKIEFPLGNQIFSIDSISSLHCSGFLQTNGFTSSKKEINTHYKFKF